VNVVGCISAYKEGRLARGAVGSLLKVGLDALYVYEGPAGDALGDDVPDSDYPYLPTLRDLMEADEPGTPCVLHRGRWRTDARKRNEMLQRAKSDFPGVLWAVVLDGDEVLYHAEYLRDLIECVQAEDDLRGADWRDPDNPPTARIPLRLVERDGGLHTITARVYRADLVREYNVSSSLITNLHGVQDGWGNRPELSPAYVAAWERVMSEGRVATLPPFPCEPCIVHRSHLRHPLRRGLRMSDQETRELRAAELRAKGIARQ
jgi:hypothetical protein